MSRARDPAAPCAHLFSHPEVTGPGRNVGIRVFRKLNREALPLFVGQYALSTAIQRRHVQIGPGRIPTGQTPLSDCARVLKQATQLNSFKMDGGRFLSLGPKRIYQHLNVCIVTSDIIMPARRRRTLSLSRLSVLCRKRCAVNEFGIARTASVEKATCQ